jgi:uncharacterized protein (DUF1330 family)
MSAIIVVDITVHDAEKYAEYVKQVPALIERHRGKYLVREGEVDVIEGSWQPQRLVILEFPSVSLAQAFLGDPDYQPVAEIRHAAASTNLILVEGT